MGLKGRLRDWIIRRELKKQEDKDMGKFFKKAVGWLNGAPGRKRGIAAAFAALGAVLRVYGYSDFAEGAVALNEVLQNVEIGADLVAFVFAIIGIGHAAKRKA